MTPFVHLTAVAAPLEMVDVDTDQIVPAYFLRRTRSMGYGSILFNNLRYLEDGTDDPNFVLNQPPYRNAQILVAGRNFGGGSSREAAAYALADYGIRAVIAPTFGEIHFHNEIRNGMLPVVLPQETVNVLHRQLRNVPGSSLTIDLEAQTLEDVDGKMHPFEIDGFAKHCLLNGLDEIDFTMTMETKIDEFHLQQREKMGWLFES